MEQESLEDTRLAITLLDVFALLRSERCNFQRISQAMGPNLPMVNKILARVNSPNFGLGNAVTEISHGVSLLGMRQLKELLLQSTGTGFYHSYVKIEPAMLEIKRHSVAVGCYSMEMAKQARQFLAKDFYEAGLVHDIGKYPLLVKLGSEYLKVMNEAEAMNYSLHLHERDVLGVDHCEVGWAIAQELNVKECLLPVIRHHHELSDKDRDELPTREVWLVDIVHFANLMSKPIEGVKKINRSLYRQYLSDLPPPPGDLTTVQLKRVAEDAHFRAMELFKDLGLS